MKCTTLPYVILYLFTKFDIYVFITEEKVLNKLAKIDYGHLCRREENISFSNNYII
jgi:hypothetical protein